jgi:hypothetical protein
MEKTFYAVCWANGLISRRLDADDLSAATKELEESSAEDLQDAIDCGSCDIDEDAGFDTSSIQFDVDGSLEKERIALGATEEWNDVDLEWSIWSWSEPEIAVGSVAEEHVPDDGEVSDLLAYVGVDVTVRGVSYRVGCCVGIRESEHGTARASGCGVYLGNGPDAWWEDQADHQSLPRSVVEPVRAELDRVARRLWSEVEAIRAE